jgi:hypothetical protein
VHLFTGFSLTAAFHVLSIASVKTDMAISEITRCCFVFFGAQAAGIVAETVVSGWWERVKKGVKLGTREKRILQVAEEVVKRVWTGAFLLVSGWWILRAYEPLRIEESDMPFPVLDWVVDY